MMGCSKVGKAGVFRIQDSGFSDPRIHQRLRNSSETVLKVKLRSLPGYCRRRFFNYVSASTDRAKSIANRGKPAKNDTQRASGQRRQSKKYRK